MLLAVIGVSGACASGAGAGEVVARAADRTIAAGTAKVSEEVRITPVAGATPTLPRRVVGEGTVDFANHRARLSLRVAGETVEVVVRGTTIYQRLPALAATTGREWLRIDLDQVGELAGVQGLADLSQSPANDPSAGLQYLRGATGRVERVGREKVRGVGTTHYRATVDIAKAASQSPPGQRRTVRRISEVFGITTLPVEAWIDEDGRARRVHQTVDYTRARPPAGLPAASLPKEVEVTGEFFDFGAPVAAPAPPPAEVVDLADLLARERAGLGSGTSSPETEALERRLIDNVPPGFAQERDNVGDTGPSDLAKAVRDDGEPDARQVLVAQGFVAGYQRLWTKGDGELIVFLYRFRSPAGAADHLARTLAGDTSGAAPLESFEVPGVPGAHGLRDPAPARPVAEVVFTRGPYLVQLVMTGPDAAPSTVAELAGRQYEKLAELDPSNGAIS